MQAHKDGTWYQAGKRTVTNIDWRPLSAFACEGMRHPVLTEHITGSYTVQVSLT